MANKNVLVGSVNPVTGVTAHGPFVSGDSVVTPDSAPLVRTHWFYGDGNSGSATISTNTTSDSNRAYENLTIAAGVTFDTGGYMLLVRGTLTMGAGSSIIRAAANASGITPGAGGGIEFYDGGTNGGNGTSGTGSAGLSASASFAGAGGKGGNSGTNIGGAGGTVVFPFAANGGDSTKGNLLALIAGTEPTGPTKFPGGSGGGGGAASGAGTGGGGGGGGRVLIVCANKIVIPTGSATIRANGGNGANGVSGNGAGGGGGGGGVCVVISSYDMPAALTVLANGGAPGTGIGSGLAGVAGSAGFSAYYKWN